MAETKSKARQAFLVLLLVMLGSAVLFYYLGYQKGFFDSERAFYDDQVYIFPKEPDPQADKYFDVRQYLYGRWESKSQPHEVLAFRISNTIDVYNTAGDLINHYTWSLVQRPEKPNGFYILENDSKGLNPRYFLVQKIDANTLQLQDSVTNEVSEYTRL